MTTDKTLNRDEIHAEVRKSYGARATEANTAESTKGCCTAETGSHDEAALRMGYSEQDLATVPEDANLGLGCGAPLAELGLGAGDTVLDLGSGAGFDVFLAARAVGPEGRAIGIDMTPEMVAKAKENAAKAGITNVEFRLGQIESMPVDDETVDAVISNCVINLSPDKPAVFREAFRVLRPGGRLAVSDIVLTASLPKRIARSLAAYVGCVAGAALLDDYLAAIRAAGFEEVKVTESRPAVETLTLDDPVVCGVLEELGVSSPDELSPTLAKVARRVVSAKVVARKPAES